MQHLFLPLHICVCENLNNQTLAEICSLAQGRVIAGRSVADESMLTGESLPVFKEEGLSVSAGTINWV